MKNQLFIKVKNSKRTGQLYWIMYGKNGEKMAHSEPIQNKTYLKNLMKRFQAMGFIILK